jgi:hypothetical protein
LRGILCKLWDLNLRLVSVIHINADWRENASAKRERRAKNDEYDSDT